MKRQTVRIFAMILAILMALSGCTTAPAEQTEATDSKTMETDKITGSSKRDTILRVATLDATNYTYDNWTQHFDRWVRKFEAAHRNVDIVVENMLGTERLQTELMAGKGPDIILAPTYAEWHNLNFREPNCPIPISDVNQAMRNGIFYDISEFYDADTELNKDALESAVMEAGVVDGKRYILPLRYNLLAAYVDLERFAETGLSTDLFEKDIISFWNALTEHGNSSLASGALVRSAYRSELNLIGDLIDYDNQEVLLAQETLVEYLQAYQDFLILRGQSDVSDCALLHNYYSVDTKNISGYSGWMESWKYMFVGGLDFAIHNAVIAKAEGVELGMYPLRSTDGSVTADITFYGAVTSGCKNPELAYEFLRYFLTEESQWEENVVTTYNNNSSLMLVGWPVRVKGSVSAIYDHLSGWIGPILQTNETVDGFSEEDMPILDVTIDKVRFPTGLEMSFQYVTASVYNPFTMTENEARSINLEKKAEDFIEDLEWHVGEG